jgi:hypothetical protein
VRFDRNSLSLLALSAIGGSFCALAPGQELIDVVPPEALRQSADDVSPLPSIVPMSAAATPLLSQPGPLNQADMANLDGCQVVARIDNQIILACDVLWRVNQLIETQKQRLGPEVKIKPEEIEAVRQQLLKREVAALVDRKLVYNEFRRTVPAENLPRIEENLRAPFEEKELPWLMKQLNVNSQIELERELARLGSSLADTRRAFNERIIAAEWIHSKVKINEEVSPDEMIEYYRAHLADYEYPTQARWEELAVRKDRFDDPAEAYAELAKMGNEVWQRRSGQPATESAPGGGTTYFSASLRSTAQPLNGAAFAEVATAKSDGFTSKKGGLHDWTTKGALQCKELDEAIFTKLQVGQMSPIIDSGPMFHIVRVLERKEAGREAYTDVQADIREKLKDERMQVEVEKYLTRLRSEARIWTVFTGHVSADTLMGRKPEPTRQK